MTNRVVVLLDDVDNIEGIKIEKDNPLEHGLKIIKEEYKSSMLILVGQGSQLEEAFEKNLGICIDVGNSNLGHYSISKNRLEGLLRRLNVYSSLLKEALWHKKKDKALVVGVNGVDTSGKSFMTKEFNCYLKALGYKTQIIHIDDFHHESKIRYSDPDPIMSYYHHAFDYEKLISQLLQPIHECEEVNKSLLHLNLDTDKYDLNKSYIVNHDTIVLLEGVLLYREPIEKYFDYKVFVDVTFDAVIERAIVRDSHLFEDVKKRYEDKYIPIQKMYLETEKVKSKVHFTIDNNDFNKPNYNYQSHKSSVELLPLTEEHMEDIRQILYDHEAKYMLGAIKEPKFLDYEDALAYVIKDGDLVVGQIELFNISYKNLRAEMSISLKQAYRGKGYGFKAIHELLYLAFTEHNLNRIWLRVLEDNLAGIKLYEKSGFVREGLCREESMRNGRYVNQIQMSILKSEWMVNYEKI